MAIKKRFTGGNPVVLLFDFLCPLAVTRDLVFSFVYGIFNNVPSFTYFCLKKFCLHSEILFMHESMHDLIFNFYL